MSEEWRIIRDTDGMYEVSSLGRVRSLDRVLHKADGTDQPWRGTVRTPTLAGRGYWSVTLRFGRRRNVHVLVCEAFHGPKPTPTHQAAHTNGDHRDNRADNLRWKTPVGNQQDSIRHGTKATPPSGSGEVNNNARLSLTDVQQIRAMRTGGATLVTIASRFGVGKSQVHNIVTGKQWLSEWKP